MRVLQFSHFNTVNVPYHYSKMYKKMGHESRLLTLYKHRGNIPEDICLNKKVYNPWWLKKIRQRKEQKNTTNIRNNKQLLELKHSNIIESALLTGRDWLRKFETNKIIKKYGLFDYDLYHLHGGVGFYRNSAWVKELASRGKIIICNYHGPDIRVRGIIKDIDKISKLNITNEYDLLEFHPNLHYIPMPYDFSDIPSKKETANANKTLTVIHTPSNPSAKGTHIIKKVLKEVSKKRKIHIKILTGKSHKTIIEEKLKSDIAIEQIGNYGGTGYGVNSLETLAMGIPTITEFTPEYKTFLKKHPFVLADKNSLEKKLIELIDNQELREQISIQGKEWVFATHDYASVWKRLREIMKKEIPHVAEELFGL